MRLGKTFAKMAAKPVTDVDTLFLGFKKEIEDQYRASHKEKADLLQRLELLEARSNGTIQPNSEAEILSNISGGSTSTERSIASSSSMFHHSSSSSSMAAHGGRQRSISLDINWGGGPE